MKLTPRIKKILTVFAVIAVITSLTGCTVPRDASGNILLIEKTTTFNSMLQDESWFSALFVWPLSQWINAMAPTLGVGLSIAVVTIIVNGVLALATLKSTVSMQKMQLIQPELQRIQRKYEGRDDETSKMRQASEMQKLYKDNNISPMGSILVTFLQFPVIMAMYMAVQRSYAVATGTFLGMDLQTTPWAGVQNLLKGNLDGSRFILLFIFMILCQTLSMMLPMWIQKRKAEAEAAKHHRKPEPISNQNKIMQLYMVGMIAVFGMMWPAAMSLYWAINSLVNVVKTILVQKYIDNMSKKEGVR